jgi:hypothetical protein
MQPNLVLDGTLLAVHPWTPVAQPERALWLDTLVDLDHIPFGRDLFDGLLVARRAKENAALDKVVGDPLANFESGGKLDVFRLTASGGRWCKVRRRLRGGTAAHLRW